MEVKITSNKKEYIITQAEMSLELTEEIVEDYYQTKAIIILSLPKLFLDISSIDCLFGKFEDVKLTNIGLGSKDMTVIYQLSTFDFLIDEALVNLFLEQSQKEYVQNLINGDQNE